MTDIHNHLLYGIDDGSKSIEESISILKKMYDFGYRNIIFTPHYIKDSRYNSPAKNNFEILKTIKRKLKELDINLNLYLGNEIFMDDDIFELLKEGKIYSLNGTSYLLIELPMSGEYPNYIEVFKDLIDKGCHVVLAHPERYLSFQKDYSKVDELQEIGVFFQSNIDSLVGKYGPLADKMLRWLLKEKKISFLATDIHHEKRDYNDWNVAKQIALKYITEEEYDFLVNVNPSKLLN